MRTILTLLLSFAVLSIHANILYVGAGESYPTLEMAAEDVLPGDTIIVRNGTYSGGQFLVNVQGTEQQPISILAEDPQGVVFQGGTEAWHLTDVAYLLIRGFIFENQTGNGVNIDDGGTYDTPSHHITIEDCWFREMNVSGNHDLLKLSGLDDFVIRNCQFTNGASGGSGIDMVGCHRGWITGCYLEQAGVSGIQAKGGTRFIRIEGNTLKDMSQRALNLGGSTGLQFFRPPLGDPIQDAFEAADLEVYSNVFIGSWSPIAYVGCVRVKVYHNTIVSPENWVIRILQETTEPGFLTCADNEFKNNIVYLDEDLTEVNIGPNTAAPSFQFSHNLWFNAQDGNWAPNLPVTDQNQLIVDPLLVSIATEDYHLSSQSPAIGEGLPLEDPTADRDGNLFLNPPSIGAFEGGETPVGLNTITPDQRLSVFPNPVSSSLEVADLPSAAGTFYLRDVLGRPWAVIPKQAGQQTQTIDLPFLPTGNYYLQFFQEDRLVGQSLIQKPH